MRMRITFPPVHSGTTAARGKHVRPPHGVEPTSYRPRSSHDTDRTTPPGSAMAQVVSRRPVAAEARVHALVSQSI
jgi:hypothetical protein